MSKALVNAQGGEITAESMGRDRGTTMTIIFKPAPYQDQSPSVPKDA
jgi:signal transduction histidine kinase